MTKAGPRSLLQIAKNRLKEEGYDDFIAASELEHYIFKDNPDTLWDKQYV